METDKILQDLISIDSQTHKSNAGITSYIQNYFQDSQKFDYVVNGVKMNNLLVKIEGKNKEPLVFVSHTDTVGIQEGWITNPLMPYQKENKIYGLGASDMKGSVACLIASSINCKPSRDTYFVFVGSEEDNSQGIRDLLGKVNFPKSQIIIPEPTNRLVYLSQKGYLEGTLEGQKIQSRFNPEEREAFFEEETKLKKYGGVIYSNPPSKTSKDSGLIRMINSLDPSTRISNNSFAGWTEAGLFNKFGDAIVFGAGNYKFCHKPNENIDLNDLDFFTNIFREIINYKN
jgi:acetylornithine deacetylase/succinyl-diaminopimelate desuccinylase-like protein